MVIPSPPHPPPFWRPARFDSFFGESIFSLFVLIIIIRAVSYELSKALSGRPFDATCDYRTIRTIREHLSNIFHTFYIPYLLEIFE